MKKIICIILLISFFSCKKENINPSLLDSISPTKHYTSEIFTKSNLILYGRWQFVYIFNDAGVIVRPGRINATYDFLEIKKYGIYGKIKDNLLIETGKIVVLKQESDQLKIKFEPDNEELNVGFYDLTFNAKDSLRMMDATVGCGFLFNQYKKVE